MPGASLRQGGNGSEHVGAGSVRPVDRLFGKLSRELPEIAKVTSKHEYIALDESSRNPIGLRPVADVQQLMRRDAQVVQDPMEYGRIRLECPDAFCDVCRFEVLGDTQTLEFVAALEVRHSHLLESERSEVTEKIRGARPSAEQFYRGPQPALFQGQPSREIVIGRLPCTSARPGTLRTAIQRANLIEITDRAHAATPKGCQQGIGDQSRP